ncbi:uncharacterized protein LOC141606599 isoform X1 [Silene latifolia]|uniref:uncharacterized protein LOC141606599 isoform X1 n=1 Tax=Silene latifolia TaxID=37657 RepID=UPI003D7800E4
MQEHIILTLCEMEKIFLPSFFDIMVHLCVHLAVEAKIAGPVQYRWMYPLERLLRRLKCYVRNKNRPEGSIAEGYIIEECMLFCSKYLCEIETKYNQTERNADIEIDGYKGLAIFKPSGIPLGKAKTRHLTDIELMQALDYILKNCEEAESYISEYNEGVFDGDLFEWFRDKVSSLSNDGGDQVLTDLQILSSGPFKGVQCYSGFLANGFRFHTKDVEKKRRNQNSGIMVKGSGCDYFGILTEIICLIWMENVLIYFVVIGGMFIIKVEV